MQRRTKIDRQQGVLSLCQSLLKPSGHGFEFSPMGTELDIPHIPPSLRHGLLRTAGFFAFQADDLVRGLEVGMAALYLSERPRNEARLRGMLIYFIGQNARAGNGLSAAGHTKASRIKAKTLTAFKKDPEIPHSCQQILK